MSSGNEVAATNRNQTILSPCATQGCCPTVTVDHEQRTLVITDDDGGKVRLTEEQWKLAVQNVKF